MSKHQDLRSGGAAADQKRLLASPHSSSASVSTSVATTSLR
jgi:hypothetical protein